MSDDYSYEIRGLDSRADDLERDLESLNSTLGSVDNLDYELRDIRDDISTLQQEHRDLDEEVHDHIGETERALKKLSARLQVLEAHTRIAAGVPEVDFDTVAAEWPKLPTPGGRSGPGCSTPGSGGSARTGSATTRQPSRNRPSAATLSWPQP
ncbi:hypothetical protein ACIG3E_23540 [Streptomyces sp. NPDC053474]|uniref:hypothetical protein n=1 Tax=Streptomyces sp. NPDC053474 TaxID=3365704 RepID=UPI0037CCD931